MESKIERVAQNNTGITGIQVRAADGAKLASFHAGEWWLAEVSGGVVTISQRHGARRTYFGATAHLVTSC